MTIPKDIKIEKVSKDIKISYTVMTRVTTGSNTYDVSISKKGITVTRRKSKSKNKVHWKETWEEIDKMFNDHDKKDSL